MNCLKCHRPVRPRESKAEDYPPDTLRAGSKGLCGPCYRTARKDGTVDDYDALPTRTAGWETQPCQGRCGRIVRRTRLKLADYPGTISETRSGRCGPCYQEQMHNGPARDQDTLRTIEENKASLEAWLATRNPTTRVRIIRL